MRRAEWILKSIVVTAIVAGLTMTAVAAGQEVREHNVESLSQYPPGGSGAEFDPGEVVRVTGKVKTTAFVRGRLEITLESVDKEKANNYFVTEIIAIRWQWFRSALPFEPRIGETITVCGISRFDRSGYRWQVNPMVPCRKGTL